MNMAPPRTAHTHTHIFPHHIALSRLHLSYATFSSHLRTTMLRTTMPRTQSPHAHKTGKLCDEHHLDQLAVSLAPAYLCVRACMLRVQRRGKHRRWFCASSENSSISTRVIRVRMVMYLAHRYSASSGALVCAV